MSKRELVSGREFILFLKQHGYIDDEKIQSITVTAKHDDLTTIVVNKYMTAESNQDNQTNNK